jgi:hypothetical protein
MVRQHRRFALENHWGARKVQRIGQIFLNDDAHAHEVRMRWRAPELRAICVKIAASVQLGEM